MITSTINLTISFLMAFTRLAHRKDRKRLYGLGQWTTKHKANSRNKTSALPLFWTNSTWKLNWPLFCVTWCKDKNDP